MNKFYKILHYTLLISTFGFIYLPVVGVGWYNPVHPRDAEDLAEEDRRHRNKYEPAPPCDEDDPRYEHRENWANKDK